MKFTVLGASGFIGRHLHMRLTEMGHKVAAPHRDEITTLPHALGHVIYAIGMTSDFRQRPFATMQAHVSLVTDLLQKHAFQSFLYLSSTRVYSQTPTNEDVLLNVHSENASDLYNISKLSGEAICLNSGLSGMRVARLSNVVGNAGLQPDTFVGQICTAAVSGHIQLRSALETRKDYIWIDDVTDLLANIAIKGTNRIYNVASGQQISHRDWVSALEQFTGCTFDVEDGAPDLSFPPIDVSRIKEEFSYTPTAILSRLPAILE